MTSAALCGSAFVVAALDQVSKLAAIRWLVEGRRYRCASFLGLRRAANVRAGLIVLSDRHAVMLWIAAMACLCLVLFIMESLPGLTSVSLGFVVGGAASNLCDRLVRGAVIDFIVVGRWPTFNLADAAMVIGTAVSGWSLL
jgi:signal peptidase II